MKNTIAIAALAGLAAAGPIEIEKRATRFTVNQESTGMKQVKSGANAYAKALGKFGAPVPDNVQAAAAAQATGSVPANPDDNDVQYTSPVRVGTNGNTLQLDFDTGSADLWVFSSETPRNLAAGHTTYNTASGTRLQGASWNISYGDGSGAAGDVYTDRVAVGAVTATRQAVEAATAISGGPGGQDFAGSDGLLGLASSTINTVRPQRQTTFFDTVKGQLDAPLFTATLKHQAPGSYDFGYIDNSKHTGTINYAPVDFSNGFWQFNVDSYSVGSSSGRYGSAIADTGTTLLLAPSAVVTAYYRGVSGARNDPQQGGYTVPCSASLPDLTLTISGNDITVPGDLINFAPLEEGSSTCFGGLQSDAGIGFSILGDIFLKAVYAVFDQGNSRFGFAPQA
ncbi:MAG: hypothetical protein Q9159_003466 [Coniocarpon cinnabarinum]